METKVEIKVGDAVAFKHGVDSPIMIVNSLKADDAFCLWFNYDGFNG